MKKNKKINVLFVYPNSAGYTRIPVGIAMLITCLKKAGHKIALFDTSFFKLKEKTDDQIREGLGQVKKTDLAQYGVVFQTKTKEEIFEELGNMIQSFVPDLIAFSVNEELMQHACELAAQIKNYSSIPIIFGGIGVTVSPEEVIEKPFIDMICIGEGEDAIVELAQALGEGGDISGIKNVWVKQDGRVIKNEVRPLRDMDSLPFLDVDDFSDKHFFRPFDGKIYRMFMFDMIRGCPYRCSYCDNHVLQSLYKNKGRYVRKKSLRRAIDELVYLRDKYRVQLFFFIDDDFCIQSEDEVSKFLQMYRREVKVPLVVQGRPNTASEKKLRELKQSDCLTICMSIESGSKVIREKVMNRSISNEVIVNTFQMAKRIGLKANSQNIIGNPDETRKEIFETIAVNRKCQPYSISTNFMTPFKGTEIRRLCVERGYIEPEFSVTTGIRGKPVLKLPQISNEELIGIQKVFSLYVKLPRLFYPLIRYCEKNRWQADTMYKALINLMWKLNK
jgi:radical SAM superfamily enzyme YgiQ (UPF0313 family)